MKRPRGPVAAGEADQDYSVIVEKLCKQINRRRSKPVAAWGRVLNRKIHKSEPQSSLR